MASAVTLILLAALAAAPAFAGQIVYDENGAIMAAGGDGSNSKQLAAPETDVPGMATLNNPNVSPAGSEVVFMGTWDQYASEWSSWNPPAPGAYGVYGEGTYKLHGGTVTRLSPNARSCHADPGVPCGAFDETPTITPSGKVIDSYSFYLLQHACDGCDWHVIDSYFALDQPPRPSSDSSGNAIWDEPAPSDIPTPCSGSDSDFRPQWPEASADGSKLVYANCNTGGSPPYALMVSGINGSSPTLCGADDRGINSPSWSLDGSKIVDSETGNVPGLWVYPYPGTCNTTNPYQALALPSGWVFASPRFIGGGRIAFVAAPSGAGGGNVWTIPASCGVATPCQFPDDAHQLTSGAGTTTVAWTSQQLTPVSPQRHSLTVSKSGTGTGNVTSSPAGIACGHTCSHAYSQGTVVRLVATAASGSTFAGWSGGGCAGAGACRVTMSARKTVTARFNKNKPPPIGVPNTTLTAAKVNKKRHKATFKFTGSGGAGALKFKCRLTGQSTKLKRWRRCSSPITYRHLRRGGHVFEVEAIDARGKADPTPAKKRFKL